MNKWAIKYGDWIGWGLVAVNGVLTYYWITISPSSPGVFIPILGMMAGAFCVFATMMNRR